MNKSLRLMMIKSANEKLQLKRKYNAQQILFEREVQQVEGDIRCSKAKKTLKRA